MRPADDIKKLIKSCKVKTSAETDERILAGAMAEMKKSKQKPSAQHEPIKWRIIMKSKITKF
ncbi:MAG: hypothetical protein KAS23_11745, partial [Anaerohalosphaera sp.]|nr:hypothetical protein [Anaerohalosphaera sp.]